MPRKGFTWLIIFIGMGVTVWATCFLMGLKENFGISDNLNQMAMVGAIIVFAAGMVATGRISKWWDNK